MTNHDGMLAESAVNALRTLRMNVYPVNESEVQLEALTLRMIGAMGLNAMAHDTSDSVTVTSS